MTSPGGLADVCHAALVRCLQTLSEGCPGLPPDTPPLHRLRSLLMVIPPSTAHPGTPSAPGLTLARALTLVSAAHGLLATLRDADHPGPVNAETGQALSETLAELSSQIGKVLRQQQADQIRGLYVIIDPQVTAGRDPLEIARAAVRGGARMLQLRDKLRDKGEVLPLAMELQKLCQANNALLIINDHVDLAAAVDSAGVHVGQTDLPVDQARRVLAPHQVLGRSNREIEQLVQSQEMGVDHVAFGSIYQTSTKGIARNPQGVERLRQARAVTRLPLVAIGGINIENVAPVVEAGADAICVTAAVGAAPDPEAAASRLVEAIRTAGGRV